MTGIKICGLKRPEDIHYINECLPDYAGFVFAESRRQVSREQAARLRQLLDEKICPVGVFVNERPEIIAELINQEVIDIAQLHGDEGETYIRELKGLLKRGKIIKAVRVAKQEDVENVENTAADYLLFDAFSKSAYGGTGRTFDWMMINGVKKSFFLAGGIHSGNIEEAIKRVKPYAVDLSSAVETDGVKDREKIIEIVRIIRNIEK